MRLCPASRASCPRPKCPRNHPGPRSKRGKVLILFLPLMGSVLPRSSVAQTPPLGSPKSGPTAKLANFRDAKIRRKAHDESKGGSRARARSRSKARSRAGNPVPVPCRLIVYQWGFAHWLRVWQKIRLIRSMGFRGISSTGKEPPVCGIPRSR